MHYTPAIAKEYYLAQHNLCRKHLRAYTKRKSAENLHQLRVAIKKMRAVLKMLSKLNSHFEYRPVFLPYKNIFMQAGAIREESLRIEKRKDNQDVGIKSNSSALIKKLNSNLIK